MSRNTSGCVSMTTRRVATTSGWEAVMQSRFMSKPAASARGLLARPSGLTVSTTWRRVRLEQLGDGGVGAAGQLLDDVQRAVGALPLVAVDVGVDEHRRLVGPQQARVLGRGLGVLLDALAQLLLAPGLAVALGPRRRDGWAGRSPRPGCAPGRCPDTSRPRSLGWCGDGRRRGDPEREAGRHGRGERGQGRTTSIRAPGGVPWGAMSYHLEASAAFRSHRTGSSWWYGCSDGSIRSRKPW